MSEKYKRNRKEIELLTLFDSSMPAAALGGYSPPTPKPAIPRATTKYHSILYDGCTLKATVDINVPMTTSEDVNNRPDLRENMSEVYPKTTTPNIAPMIKESLIRVFISEGNPADPSNFLKMTLVGLANEF